MAKTKHTVTRRDLEALVAAKHCKLEVRKGGSWPEVLIEAPKRHRFASENIHEMVVAGHRGESIQPLYAEAWKRLFDATIAPCDPDFCGSPCEWWEA